MERLHSWVFHPGGFEDRSGPLTRHLLSLRPSWFSLFPHYKGVPQAPKSCYTGSDKSDVGFRQSHCQ